jgi:hypothetical protein
MSAGQDPDAHQELSYDFPTGESECLPKQRHPLGLGPRVVRLDPAGERPVGAGELEHPTGVGDRGVHLEPVSYDAGIAQEPAPIARAVSGDDARVEPLIRPPKGLALLEDGEPGQAGLVDLQDQPLEQLGVAPQREAVLAVVIGPVPFVAGSDVAVREAQR